MTGPRNPERGARAARELGAEYQANPGSSRREYMDAAAYYFGPDKETVADLSPKEKAICAREFMAGIQAEKSLK